MIYKIKYIFFITLILYIFIGNSYAEMTTSKIAKKFAPSVVTIVALDKNNQPMSLGSGFFINSKGYIVTNLHVLNGSYRAIIKTTSGKKGEVVEAIKIDPKLDLIVAKTTLKDTQALSLGDSDKIVAGENIVAIGNPGGLEGSISKGIISGIRKKQHTNFIQITAPISPGSSGGPVFNFSGEVIGVATSYLEYGQNLNFAMPINYLDSLKKTSLKISSLPKNRSAQDVSTDASQVKITQKKLTYGMNEELEINFSIKNNGNYKIKNILLYFIYKNNNGEIIDYSNDTFGDLPPKFAERLGEKQIFPNLAARYTHIHHIDHFKDGKVEIRILDYDIDRTSRASPTNDLLNNQ